MNSLSKLFPSTNSREIQGYSTTDEDKKSFSELPDELLLKIFYHLETLDLTNVRLICKNWRRIGSDEALWRKSFPQINMNAGLYNIETMYYIGEEKHY